MSAPTSAPVADDEPLPAQSALDEFPAQIEDQVFTGAVDITFDR
jgi:hypothetical protein